MKKITIFLASFMTTAGFAQNVSGFEDLTLAPNSYNDGSSGSGAFMSGGVSFQNSYNTAWAYWDAGFAYSNQGDITVAPSDYLTQMYQTKAGAGYGGSGNFAVGQQGAKITFPNYPAGGNMHSVYITNTTFAYNSMALGDGIGKKFGDTLNSPHSAAGIHGSYPDWFLLDITGYFMGNPIADTVHFYLADFRFANDSLDYIVSDWTLVDLSPLGVTDSLVFSISSSDVGAFGINTPTYFCIDNLTTSEIVTGITEVANPLNITAYPNPFENTVSVTFENTNQRTINVYNALGALVYSAETNAMSAELNLEGFNAGIYFVSVSEGMAASTLKVIKKQ